MLLNCRLKETQHVTFYYKQKNKTNHILKSLAIAYLNHWWYFFKCTAYRDGQCSCFGKPTLKCLSLAHCLNRDMHVMLHREWIDSSNQTRPKTSPLRGSLSFIWTKHIVKNIACFCLIYISYNTVLNMYSNIRTLNPELSCLLSAVTVGRNICLYI